MESKKAFIYQIYYNNSQLPKLNKNSIPILNETLTPYFENSIILDTISSMKDVNSLDVVGIFSWKFESKNNCILKYSDFGNSGIVIPKNVCIRENVISRSNHHHPKFRKLFVDLLENIKIDSSDISNIQLGVYQNAIYATYQIYLDYVNNYLKTAIQYLDSQKENKDLWSDSLYSGYGKNVRERLNNYLGVNYITYHTFLLERLWSVYIYKNSKNLNIQII